MSMSPLELFVIAVSADWRLASLVANEEGPFSMFERLRSWAKRLTENNRFWQSFRLSKGLECEWCNSIWIGAAITLAWYLIGSEILWLLLPFAMSTWVIGIKYVIQTLEQVRLFMENKTDEQLVDRLLAKAAGKEKVENE
jgi:hypothetical protein